MAERDPDDGGAESYGGSGCHYVGNGLQKISGITRLETGGLCAHSDA